MPALRNNDVTNGLDYFLYHIFRITIILNKLLNSLSQDYEVYIKAGQQYSTGSSIQLFLGILHTSVWLALLVKALAARTHVRSCVQEVQVRYPERTSSTLASIPSA